MKFFYEHSEFLPYVILILLIIFLVLLCLSLLKKKSRTEKNYAKDEETLRDREERIYEEALIKKHYESKGVLK